MSEQCGLAFIRRTAAYLWAAPATAVGLSSAVLIVVSGGAVRLHTGVIEAHGGFATWALRHLVPLPGGAAAMTLGHVVIGLNQATLDHTRTHERVHVRQYERWGPAFIPAYLGVSVWLRLIGRDAYRDNPFEKEAWKKE